MAHGTAVQRQQKVAQGTTTRVLLRADTLLRVLGSSSPGPGATPKAASGSGFGGGGGFSTAPGGFNNNGNKGFSYSGFRGQEEPAETGFSLSLPTSPRKPAPEAGIGAVDAHCYQYAAPRLLCCLPCRKFWSAPPTLTPPGRFPSSFLNTLSMPLVSPALALPLPQVLWFLSWSHTCWSIS